ncbi:tetratricopeptide repeat protein [Clostridiales bacterium oral taxon 876 str. F0540]|nr:tetratricopeptide repeat protein [Clostridiales bacterium oral taxon 876 str. F0540]
MENNIGIKIKDLRLKNKLSQKELCGNFMDRSLLSKIETNVLEPSIAQLKYISNKLCVPISYFFTDLDYNNHLEPDLYSISYLSEMYLSEEYLKIIKKFEIDFESFNKIEDFNKYFYLGMSYYRINYDNDSIKLLRKYINTYEKCNNTIQEANVINFANALNALCKIMLKNSNYIKAEHYLLIGKKYLLDYKKSDSFINFVIHNNLGFVFNNLNKFSNTIALLEGFTTLNNNICYNQIMPHIHWSLNIAYYNIGDYKNSIKHIKKSIYLFKYIDNNEELGRCYMSYINTLRYCKEFNKAFDLIKNYEQDFSDNESMLCKLSLQKIILSFNLNNYEEALNACSKLSYDKLDKKYKMDYCFVLGHIYFLKKKFTKAKNYLKKCEKYYTSENYTYDLILLYEDLYIITQEEKYFDKLNYFKNKHGRRNLLI